MSDFVVKQLPYDLSGQARLALIGKYLKRINLNALVDPAFPVRSGIANLDIYLLRLVGRHTLDEPGASQQRCIRIRMLLQALVRPRKTRLAQRWTNACCIASCG